MNLNVYRSGVLIGHLAMADDERESELLMRIWGGIAKRTPIVAHA